MLAHRLQLLLVQQLPQQFELKLKAVFGPGHGAGRTVLATPGRDRGAAERAAHLGEQPGAATVRFQVFVQPAFLQPGPDLFLAVLSAAMGESGHDQGDGVVVPAVGLDDGVQFVGLEYLVVEIAFAQVVGA